MSGYPKKIALKIYKFSCKLTNMSDSYKTKLIPTPGLFLRCLGFFTFQQCD